MKILLATEDPNLRLSLELILSEEPSVTVSGAASEAEGLAALIRFTHPAIVLLDWNLPGRPAADIIAEVRQTYPETNFIVLGLSPAGKQQALSAGAAAFVVKGDPPDQLLRSFRTLRKQSQSTSTTVPNRGNEN
jgi:DNA-binding NarL/FixJ family response regulator